jgi:uncharacterized protein DUF6134
MGRRLAKWSVALAMGVAWLAGQTAPASEVEVREFSIQVGGKSAGQCVMTMTKEKDGTETMSAKANVRIKILLANYVFTCESAEVWRNGRLSQMQSKTDDNGKKVDVSVSANGEGLRVLVNGKEQPSRPEIWPSSYWRLADAKFHNNPVWILEVDTGKESARRLEYVGVEPVTLGGRQQNCHHYRVTGGPSPIDLWYDGQLRLVRQLFTEDGHRTEFLLTGLRRPQPQR